jgi:hypothetical protein
MWSWVIQIGKVRIKSRKKIERLIKRKKVLTVEEVWQSKGSIQMVMVKLIGE